MTFAIFVNKDANEDEDHEADDGCNYSASNRSSARAMRAVRGAAQSACSEEMLDWSHVV